MHPRFRSGLTIFGHFTAIGLLFFGYLYLETVASHDHVSPLEPFINEVLTGAWMAAILFPFIVRFARRYPVSRWQWLTRVRCNI